jgi:hypothetical protein
VYHVQPVQARTQENVQDEVHLLVQYVQMVHPVQRSMHELIQDPVQDEIQEKVQEAVHWIHIVQEVHNMMQPLVQDWHQLVQTCELPGM